MTSKVSEITLHFWEGRTMATLHIRHEGRSVDVRMEDVDLGDLSSEQEVRQAAATYFGQPVEKFNAMMIERNQETGDITMRPQAIFG